MTALSVATPEQIAAAVQQLRENYSAGPLDPGTDLLALINGQLATTGQIFIDPQSQADYANAFRASVLLAVPGTQLLGAAKRQVDTDEWSCWWCYYGTIAIIYGLLAAGGAALAATLVVAPETAPAIALAVKVAAAAITAIIANLANKPLGDMIGAIAEFVCTSTNLCSPLPPLGLFSEDKSLGWRSTTAPALTRWSGGLAMVHRGDADDQLWWGTYSPGALQWVGDQAVSSIHLKGQPTATAFLDRVWVFYNRSSDGALCVNSTSDFTGWFGEITIPGLTSAIAPGVAVIHDADSGKNGVVCLYTDSSGAMVATAIDLEALWSGQADGSWTIFAGRQVPYATHEIPSIVGYANQPSGPGASSVYYVAYKDPDDSQAYVTSTTDFHEWGDGFPASNEPIIGGPSLAVVNDELYCVFTRNDNRLGFSIGSQPSPTSAMNWVEQPALDKRLSACGPVAARQGSMLLVAHRGNKDKGLWWTYASP